MAKDYFSDIQPEPQPPRALPSVQRPLPPGSTPAGDTRGNERSIRNISVPARRVPIITSPKVGAGDIRGEQMSPNVFEEAKPRRPRLYIWLLASFAILGLLGALLYFLWDDTSVTVTPRTHKISFDDSTQFTAYPEGSATEGTISYRTETAVIEDSATVPATGVEKTSDRATGAITVFNEYSSASVRLIKNTRFQTPSGLIFRIPASVDVPGKKGSTPGQISVTVIADQPGPEYNVGPINKLTLPGLKTSPDMYSGVYAQSSTAFSGGFVGDKPAVSREALDGARSSIRGRLQEKIRAAVAAYNTDDAFAFPGLVHVVYESLPTTPDSGGSARVQEKAIVTIPVFPASRFSQSIAGAVSADAAGSIVMLKPDPAFNVVLVGESEMLGKHTVKFTISGSAVLVWHVDGAALAQALAGREQAAFETIIGGFSGVEKAEANVAPFWKNEFPKDPSDITVKVVTPTQ